MKRIGFLFFIASLCACTHDNEEAYFSLDEQNCNTESIYYIANEASRSVFSIIENKCLNCHGVPGNSAQNYPIDYAFLSQSYGNILLDIINGVATGISKMPKEGSPQLTSCEKNQIESWINNDFPEYEE